VLPDAQIGTWGRRDELTLEPTSTGNQWQCGQLQVSASEPDVGDRGFSIDALNTLKAKGHRIYAMSICRSLRLIQAEKVHPDVPIYLAALDERPMSAAISVLALATPATASSEPYSSSSFQEQRPAVADDESTNSDNETTPAQLPPEPDEGAVPPGYDWPTHGGYLGCLLSLMASCLIGGFLGSTVFAALSYLRIVPPAVAILLTVAVYAVVFIGLGRLGWILGKRFYREYPQRQPLVSPDREPSLRCRRGRDRRCAGERVLADGYQHSGSGNQETGYQAKYAPDDSICTSRPALRRGRIALSAILVIGSSRSTTIVVSRHRRRGGWYDRLGERVLMRWRPHLFLSDTITR
jgi:hypothetical protein